MTTTPDNIVSNIVLVIDGRYACSGCVSADVRDALGAATADRRDLRGAAAPVTACCGAPIVRDGDGGYVTAPDGE